MNSERPRNLFSKAKNHRRRKRLLNDYKKAIQ